jgi:hypothetical protein
MHRQECLFRLFRVAPRLPLLSGLFHKVYDLAFQRQCYHVSGMPRFD